jgi:hypothetical protein
MSLVHALAYVEIVADSFEFWNGLPIKLQCLDIVIIPLQLDGMSWIVISNFQG